MPRSRLKAMPQKGSLLGGLATCMQKIVERKAHILRDLDAPQNEKYEHLPGSRDKAWFMTSLFRNYASWIW